MNMMTLSQGQQPVSGSFRVDVPRGQRIGRVSSEWFSRPDERLALIVPGRDEPVVPTHWSFGQLCTLVGAPTSYLRQLPAALSAINLQHGLLAHRGELVKTLEADNGRVELRAVTPVAR